MRDAISRILRWWVVALILLAATGIAGGRQVRDDNKSATPIIPRDGGKNLAATQSAPTSVSLRSPLSDRLNFRIVKTLPDKGVISAFEPVVIEVEVTNISSELIELEYAGDLCTRIEVRDSQGKLVGDSPIYSYADFLSSIKRLVPGQSMRSFFIPSAVYRFSNPGNYAIRIMLLELPKKITAVKPSDLGPIIAETTMIVQVLPFDEQRLKRRCAQLIERGKPRPSTQYDFPPFENRVALFSIRHNAALPALKSAAEFWDSWRAVVAIKRVGTPESAALLKSLAIRKDKLGKSARAAERENLRINSGDYHTLWTYVTSPEATVNEFLYYYRHQQWEQTKSLFNDYFLHKHAAEFKNTNPFAGTVAKSVQSILNDPKSKPLRTRKEGKFVIVEVGQEARDKFGPGGLAHFQVFGGGGNWLLTDFPR